MRADRSFDLVCMSYLADAQVLRVAAYPRANTGAVVDQTAASIAGDGPLTAALAAGLGLRVGLIANQVGVDPAGRRLLDWLTATGIDHRIHAVPGICTPQLTVVADEAGTRTWVAWLQHAYDDLRTADLDLLTRSRLAYIDCYQVLTAAAVRAVAAAGNTALLLDLGGDPLDDQIVAAADGRRVLAVQTSLDESAADDADALAVELSDRLNPEAAVVTLGRLGASVGRSSARGQWMTPTLPLPRSGHLAEPQLRHVVQVGVR